LHRIGDSLDLSERDRGAALGPHAPYVVEDTPVLWAIVAILLVLWLLGLLGSIGGGLIHILLVIALVVVVAQLLTGRRAV
jgi:hypothetical protein